ncbi:MAG: type II toxin-antitoxin system RelE/ParE family toxin [Firmicutes bacterium]|nr:type II toxin-antitoxin system RelE/ParE family toxin [Bacillota bacterium]
MKQTVLTDEALADIDSIYNYIALDSVNIASKQVTKINLQIKKVSENPNIYPIVEGHSDRFENLRKSVINPYIILFDNRADLIVIVGVVHTKRDYKKISKQRKTPKQYT